MILSFYWAVSGNFYYLLIISSPSFFNWIIGLWWNRSNFTFNIPESFNLNPLFWCPLNIQGMFQPWKTQRSKKVVPTGWLINDWDMLPSQMQRSFAVFLLKNKGGEKQRFHQPFECQHSPVSLAFWLSWSFYFWVLPTAATMGKEQVPWADHSLGWYPPPHKLPCTVRMPGGLIGAFWDLREVPILFLHEAQSICTFTREHQWPYHRCEQDTESPSDLGISIL